MEKSYIQNFRVVSRLPRRSRAKAGCFVGERMAHRILCFSIRVYSRLPQRRDLKFHKKLCELGFSRRWERRAVIISLRQRQKEGGPFPCRVVDLREFESGKEERRKNLPASSLVPAFLLS
jgi:hypothetical protein